MPTTAVGLLIFIVLLAPGLTWVGYRSASRPVTKPTALRELGTTIDLHGGGTDLIFPHHECERAQSEAATGEPFVRHWMHVGLVRMDGEKMSKSLGNLVFVSDLLKTWDPRAIRLAIIEHHYRDSWEWDEHLMPRAAARLRAGERLCTSH